MDLIDLRWVLCHCAHPMLLIVDCTKADRDSNGNWRLHSFEWSIDLMTTPNKLLDDAKRIWRAGVAASSPKVLIRQHFALTGSILCINEHKFDLRQFERIVIVGAGKAAGAIALELENVLGLELLASKQVTGWLNVPSNCVVLTRCITLHNARPAEINEPTREALYGTERILQLVGSLTPSDLCICVITGGASALLSAPAPGVRFDDKLQVTRLMSAAGADIHQLNTIRRHLSLVKNGGLASACRAGLLVSLLVSDVPGDHLDIIGSGPTAQRSPDVQKARDILLSFQLPNEPCVRRISTYLASRVSISQTRRTRRDQLAGSRRTNAVPRTVSVLLGNNASAVDGASAEARRLGYHTTSECSTIPEGPAEAVGRKLARFSNELKQAPLFSCHVSGGETSVTLVDESQRGRGGRNQQLALAYLIELERSHEIAFVSGGTDGEDGPTNAAGAFVTEEVVNRANRLRLDPSNYLARNDAYTFFQHAGGLLVTGPTQTNVADLRVVVVRPS